MCVDLLKKKLLLSCGIFLSTFAYFHEVSAQAAQQSATLYENVRVFDGKSQKLSSPSNVLVVGNLIKNIANKPIEIPAGLSVTKIAGDGRTLMPGLIDAHTHIYLGAPSICLCRS